jgi:hypothetical protein
VPVLAQLAGDDEAVFARQAEVEQHEVGGIGGHQRHQRMAGMQLADPIAVVAQVTGEQLGDVGFVVDDGDVRWGHGPHFAASAVRAGR